jgi:two-component system cell cycle response regulator
VDRRAFVALALGAAGFALGIVAAAVGSAPLAVISGAVALTGGVVAASLALSLRRAGKDRQELVARVATLEQANAEEARARADAEAKLASRIELTAMRKGTESNVLTDEATGLFSEGYFTVALDARIATARRHLRPVAVVLMEVIHGLDAGSPLPADPTEVARSIRETLREADTASRLLDGGYALVLEDTTENGAIWTVERIRRQMAGHHPGLTMWAGVACYPAHGLTTEEVLDRADLALDMAREWRQDRIEVATADS